MLWGPVPDLLSSNISGVLLRAVYCSKTQNWVVFPLIALVSRFFRGGLGRMVPRISNLGRSYLGRFVVRLVALLESVATKASKASNSWMSSRWRYLLVAFSQIFLTLCINVLIEENAKAMQMQELEESEQRHLAWSLAGLVPSTPKIEAETPSPKAEGEQLKEVMGLRVVLGQLFFFLQKYIKICIWLLADFSIWKILNVRVPFGEQVSRDKHSSS